MNTIAQLKASASQILAVAPRVTAAAEQIDMVNDCVWQLMTADAVFAMQISRAALEQTQNIDYARGRAYALRNIGWSYLVTDRCHEAEKYLNDSLLIFTQVGDQSGSASVKNGLAAVAKKNGCNQVALESYAEALDLYKQANNKTGVALILKNLGCVYARFGDYAQAFDYYYQALPASKEAAAVTIHAHAYCDLGDILWRVGEAELAVAYLHEALDFYRQDTDVVNMSAALVNLGASYCALKQYRQASDYFWQSLQIAREFENAETEIEAHIGLGNVYCEAGEAQTSINHFWQALEAAQGISSRFYSSEAMLSLGLAYQRLGARAQSIELLLGSLKISQEIKADGISYKTHLALSEAYELGGNADAALRHYKLFHQTWQSLFGVAASRHVEKTLRRLRHVGKTPFNAAQPSSSNLLDDEIFREQTENVGLTPRQLRTVIELIEQHFEKKLGSKEMADATGLSEGHFRRSFKLSTGQTPHQYLLRERITRAEQLLQNTNLPISEIAYQCGFASQSHLITQFRLIMGQTPKHFRQQP